VTSNTLLKTFAFLTAVTVVPAMYPEDAVTGPGGISHVLLISIDGMHALDFVNCSHGISGANNGLPYCPNLASLATDGRQLHECYDF
jgi:predicted AlkP superfamily pyrophosphatase or phosphodiesterase